MSAWKWAPGVRKEEAELNEIQSFWLRGEDGFGKDVGAGSITRAIEIAIIGAHARPACVTSPLSIDI